MPDRNPLKTWLAIAAIAAATISVYANSLRNDFAFDEHILITENHSIRSLKNIPDFFSSKFWPGQARGIYYRPIITTSYALNYRSGRTEPIIYHATNLAFHALNCILVFILLRRLKTGYAFLAALFFAVHPVHTESVTWISGRTDVIAVFFMLCAWLAWIKAGESSEGKAHHAKKTLWLSLTLFAYALALLSKEIAVVFPFLVFILDSVSGHKGDKKGSFKRKAPGYLLMLALVAAYLVVRQRVLEGPGPEPAPAFFAGHHLLERLQVMAVVWLAYLRLLFFPHPLRIDYYYSQAFSPDDIPAAAAWLAALFILIFISLAVLHRRRRPLFSGIVICCALSMVPFSHLISIPTLMAERFLYLPSIFTCLAVAWLISSAFRKNRLIAAACAILALVFLSSLTLSRNRVWRDGYSFWRVSVRQAPDLPEGRNLMGLFAARKGRIDFAKSQFRAAIELDPAFSQAKMNLSQIYFREGDLDTAENLLLEAVEENPSLSSAHYNLALVYSSRKETLRAVEELKAAVRLEPKNLPAHYKLGETLMQLQDSGPEAERHLMQALELDPGYLPAIIRLAELAERDGRLRESIDWIKRGLDIDPENHHLLVLERKLERER